MKPSTGAAKIPEPMRSIACGRASIASHAAFFKLS
jgi:hypothetical protein